MRQSVDWQDGPDATPPAQKEQEKTEGAREHGPLKIKREPSKLTTETGAREHGKLKIKREPSKLTTDTRTSGPEQE